MNFSKAQKQSERFRIALFGKKTDLMNKIEDRILEGAKNQESHSSLERMKEILHVQMTIVGTNLASELKQWSSDHQPFQFNYENCSKDVTKRKKELESKRNRVFPQKNPQTTGAQSSSETVSYIVLLGKAGTGKSASANTILAAGNSHNSVFPTLVIGNSQQDSNQPFASYPSSTPVTTKCEVKKMKVGAPFVVVDTPDFFYEDDHVLDEQLEECKKYCQPGRCVVLLVVQLGRFTEGESEILEKLEEHLGWEIRGRTIVLFTHGEDLNVDVDRFIGERSHLKRIVQACGGRYHVFKNTTKNSKQVIELIKKFPHLFPNIQEKHQSSQCSLS
ncbi:GTPase IMAP family member 2-like isoform X2 [Archocentrus centrarchus]|uniref:GTPase IMAP family member 2-like isoform X2 n=1 Tax=Archocentrus centrarchus TaxID=63155 RepID=UPI0011E9EC3F|nr:GTPase IMAP family member 2-like isoform X2 [Archocentrus centrarchus]